jgi:hypothetical protein
MLHALASYHAQQKTVEVGQFQAKAFNNLWTNKDKLNAYTRALLALAAHGFGYNDQAKTLVQNLENGVKIDSTQDVSIVQTGAQSTDPSVIGNAHWGEDGIYWRWSDGGVEATSFALRALLAIDPQNKLIEPVTNWLIKNRRGAQWSNTRDTAIVVMTLDEYLRTSKEIQAQMGYELLVNGKSIATKQISADDALSAPTQFEIPRDVIRDGANEITIRRQSGSGPIYFFGPDEVFQSGRTADAGRQRDLRAASVFQTRQSSDAFERLRFRTRPAERRGNREERRARRDGAHHRSQEQL